ncbi:outer membrane efflux protein [Desulfurobacterium thermolithotrophum DSM 11699]|uniref:Outer membrane efflux protein n=1 Tax=Desulfurobacterium thermolithotrophum (strain DSM 11699 / BSA) TaxID=868864 RepID=F0S2R4_DESTD|nr:TolC family protein [Desulfurobacterium thermolithotrophum]ADY73136.1 outer membrane efflux protein [Desulfurobacterium thermolithotrophum DSM 11699]
MKSKLVAFFLLLTSSAYGITLEKAIETALKKNNLILAKRYELKEKESNLKISKLHLLPTIDLYSEYNKTTDPPYAIMNRMEVHDLNMVSTNFNDPGKSQLFKTGVRATVPIWFGGKLRINTDLKKKEVEATKKQLKKDIEKVIFDVVNAYYNLLTAKAFVETAQLAVKDAEKRLKDAEVTYRSGLGLKSDYLRAKVYLKEMEENLVKAKSNYEIAKRALNLAIGLPISHQIEVNEDLTFKNFQFNLSDLIKTALRNRPELKELRVKLSQAKDMERLARSDFSPRIGAFGDYFIASDKAPWNKENSSWVFGVQASLNIFDGGIKFEKLRKSRISQLKIKEYIEKAKKGIEFEVSKAYFRFQEAKKRVELAEEAIKEAQESLRIVEKRYKNGLATISELLDTQTALNQARSNYVAALSAYRRAVAEIYYAEGILKNRYFDLAN